MNNTSGNTNLVQSVERALDILNALSEFPNGCGIGELSKYVGLSKSTVHRLLSTLKHKEYVIQIKDNDKYMLGTQILYLSSCIRGNMDIIHISKPYISKFVNEIGEVAHLCIPDESFKNIIYIDKISPSNSNRSISMSSKIGKKAPIYCTASGKLLLSQFSDEKIKNILKDIDFVKYTDNTIKNINDLLDDIHAVRTNSYALDKVEYEDGIICIAVPIFNSKREIAATISVSCVIIFKTIDNLLEYREDLFLISKQISKLLGFISWYME